MTDMDETPTSRTTWFGFERVRVDYKNHAVDITVGSESAWDRSHLRRLRQSSDLPGHVPVIDADVSSEGRPYVVTAAVEEPTLAQRLASKEGVSWNDSTGIVTAVARACHEAHDRGLFHGSLCADDVYVINDEIAVDGLGLTKGGDIPTTRDQWVAPEVLAGDTPTARSDVYSLGKLLEAALGDAADLVPRSVKRLIMWSSSDTPEARPRSASEFAEILSDGLGESKNAFRPAFIPTIRANNLTADAEKAVADSKANSTDDVADAADNPEMAKLSNDIDGPTQDKEANEIDSENEARSDSAENEAAAPNDGSKHDSASDDTDQLEIVELADAPASPSDTGRRPDETETDSTPPRRATTGEHSVSGAKATATAGAGAVAAAAAANSQRQSSGSAAKPKQATPWATKPSQGKEGAREILNRPQPTSTDDKRSWSRYLVPALVCASIPVLLWFLLRTGGSEEKTASSAQTESSTIVSNDPAGPGVPTESVGESPEGQGGDDVQMAPAVTQVAPDPALDEPATSESSETEIPATPAPETPDITVPETEGTTVPGSEARRPATTEAPEAVTREPGPKPPATESVKPIKASEAAIQIVHGIPATPADIYIDGGLAAPAFLPGNVAGPVDLATTVHDIQVFAASDNPSQLAEERSDDPLLDEKVAASNEPTTLIAHLDDSGVASLSSFVERLENLEAGETRVIIRNLAAGTGEATVTVDGQPQTSSLKNTEERQVQLSPGKHSVELITEEGKSLTANINLVEGELTTITFVGSEPNSSQNVVVQRYSGLSSAPTAVPTGDSGLLDSGLLDSDRGTGAGLGLAGIALILLLGGSVIARMRRRSLA